MRNLCEHWVRQILHHQSHSVRFSPTGAEQRAGLGFAGFERHTRPTQLAPEAHVLPVVRALVEKQRLALAATVRVDGVLFEVIRKGLLHIQEHLEKIRILIVQVIQNRVHIIRLGDGAVEISRQPFHAAGYRDVSHFHKARVIPRRVCAAQFYFQALEAIGLYPIGEQHRMLILRLAAGQLAFVQWIYSADEMPRRHLCWRLGNKKVFRIFSRKGNSRRRRFHEIFQRPAHPFAVVRLVNIPLVQISKRIVQRNIKK